MQLYELVGADGLRFSPYCWRIRLALAHKGLNPDLVPCRFTDKDKLAFSGQDKVPVLLDGDQVVNDSWAIACYLETHYPERPTLFGGRTGRALARFVNHWADTQLHPALLRALVNDIHDRVDPADREYFRSSREARLGKPLEVLREEAPHYRKMVAAILTPVRNTLADQPFLAGEQPAYPDYIVMGSLQWAHRVSDVDVLAPEDSIHAWRERLRQLRPELAQGEACPG